MSDLKLNFYPEDWLKTKYNWEAWWAGDLERPLIMVEGFDLPYSEQGINIHNYGDMVINLAKINKVDQILDYFEPRIAAKRFYGDAFPKWKITFGPGIIAGFLGAKVQSTDETVWFEPKTDTPIDQMSLEYHDDNPWWQRIQDLTRAAENRWGNQLTVAHTDLGGNFDILASLRTTQKLLFELYDYPDEVGRLIKEITYLWIRYYDALYEIIQPGGRGTTPWAPIWSPGKCYMLQSDFAYMLSPRMFEQYVMPDLDLCCKSLDHAFYHLDGKGQIPHLKLLLELNYLHGIQWIPGDGAPPAEEWLPLLKKIRDSGKLVQLFINPEGAIKIINALGGKGFAFYITEQMNRENADNYLAYAHSLV